MSKQQNQRVLMKDDSDLFELVEKLTAKYPPLPAWDNLLESEPAVQIELPFSILFQAIDQLSLDQVILLYWHIEDRLVKSGLDS